MDEAPKPSTKETMRRKWRDHWGEFYRVVAEAKEQDLLPGDYDLPMFPDELRGLTCGARSKRTDEPCKQTAIYANGRCKFHGGLSTGPTTEAGKCQARDNGKPGGRPRKNPSPCGVKKC
jgi:hypothetical protein